MEVPDARVRVFLSYASTDIREARRLYEALDPRLFDVFFDREWLPAGAGWESELERRLDDAEALVVLVTRATSESAYVHYEIEQFVGRSKATGQERPIVPVLRESGAAPMPALERFQWLDFRHMDDWAYVRPISASLWDATRGRGWRTGSGRLGDALSPRLIAQLINLGVGSATASCAQRAYPGPRPGQTACGQPAALACVSCLKATCLDPSHVASRFLTVGRETTEDGRNLERVRFFYWCDGCRGPLCVGCLDTDEGHPCEVRDVASYRFHCPACRGLVRVVVLFGLDCDAGAERARDWARSGGPPLEERPEGGGAAWRRVLASLGTPGEEELERVREAAAAGDRFAARKEATILIGYDDLDGAKLALGRAEEIGDIAAYAVFGHAVRERGNLADAEAAFRRGAELGDPDAAVSLAELLLDWNKPYDAIELLRPAAEHGHPECSYWLAVAILMMRGDHAEASRAAAAALYARDPAVAAAAHALCVALGVPFSYSLVEQTGTRRQTLTRHIAVLTVIQRLHAPTIEEIARETGMEGPVVTVALDLLMRGGSVERDEQRYRLVTGAFEHS